MLTPRWQKVISDLWGNTVRTLLVISSIAVGVFAIGMIAGAYVIISQDMRSSYEAGNPANIVIQTTAFDEDFLDTVEHVPGVQMVEGRRFVNVQVKTGANEWQNLQMVVIPDFDDQKINLFTTVNGAAQPDDRQLVLEIRALEDIPATVGDSLTIRLSDGMTLSIPYVGTVRDLSTSAGDYYSAPLSYITPDTLDWLRMDKYYSTLYVTVSGDRYDEDIISQVADRVEEKLEENDMLVTSTKLHPSNEHPMAGTVEAVLNILLLLGVLIVFLSSSLIANTLSALISQHLQHIGIMKLTGARSFQVVGMYIALIVMFGAVSLIVAIPLGSIAAYALSKLAADAIVFSLSGFRIIPFAIILQCIIAVVIPLIASLIPVLNGARVTVLEAVSDYKPSYAKMSKGWLDRFVVRVRWLSRPVLLSIRNTFRHKGRLALTLFTLILGGAIFIAVFNVQVSLNQYVTQVGRYFLADVNLEFDTAYRIDEVEAHALNVPGVTMVEGWAVARAEVVQENTATAKYLEMFGPPVDSALINPIILEGRWVTAEDTQSITINESIWQTYPELHPGDTLSLKIAGEQKDWTVVGIFQFIGRESLIAYTTYNTLAKTMHLSNEAYSFRIGAEDHSMEAQEELCQQIGRYFRETGYRISTIDAGLSSLNAASEGLNILISFLVIMALLTALVGCIGLMGTMGMNVLDRTREIGVMRAIGAVDQLIIRSVMIEGSIIGIISWMGAVARSFPISILLSNIISQAIFNTPMVIVYTWTGFVIWLGLVLILSALASVLPALNAARLTIREVLAYE